MRTPSSSATRCTWRVRCGCARNWVSMPWPLRRRAPASAVFYTRWRFLVQEVYFFGAHRDLVTRGILPARREFVPGVGRSCPARPDRRRGRLCSRRGRDGNIRCLPCRRTGGSRSRRRTAPPVGRDCLHRRRLSRQAPRSADRALYRRARGRGCAVVTDDLHRRFGRSAVVEFPRPASPYRSWRGHRGPSHHQVRNASCTG